MSETQELTTPEVYEALPEIMAELRADMHSKIDYAVSLGVFTPEDAAQWESGFEACTEVEHMEGLLEIIDDFIDSGWAVVSAIEDLLASDDLSETEKSRVLIQMEMMSFPERVALQRSLERTLADVSRQKARLKAVLARRKVESNDANALEIEFARAASEAKVAVVKKAEAMSQGGGNSKSPVYAQLEVQIQNQDPANARQILESHFPKELSYVEYARLDNRINHLEVNQKRQDILRAAA